MIRPTLRFGHSARDDRILSKPEPIGRLCLKTIIASSLPHSFWREHPLSDQVRTNRTTTTLKTRHAKGEAKVINTVPIDTMSVELPNKRRAATGYTILSIRGQKTRCYYSRSQRALLQLWQAFSDFHSLAVFLERMTIATEGSPLTLGTTFYVKARPQGADLCDIVRAHCRIFIGYPAWKRSARYQRQRTSRWLLDISLPDSERNACSISERHGRGYRAQITANRWYARNITLSGGIAGFSAGTTGWAGDTVGFPAQCARISANLSSKKR
jgi:hypothetical protein